MIRKTLYFLGQVLFIPHIILFLLSPEKETIIEDIYARKLKKQGILNHCYFLSLELLLNSYFRTLFYFRTNGNFSKILRIFYPKSPSFFIDINTRIDGGLQLAHPYSTILNAEKIGKDVYVNHLVTLGEKNGKKPVVGNKVELHAGCIVIGGITIGDNAIIGAGAVVVEDVPENGVAVGNPARILIR
jgi:serine O-acetyltransferase